MGRKASGRRFWSVEEKRLICRQARLPGVSVSQVARRYDVNSNQVFTWLRDERFCPADGDAASAEGDGLAGTASGDGGMTIDGDAGFLPVEIVADASARTTPAIRDERSTGLREERADHCANRDARSGVVEIELAGGHRVRASGAYDPDALARLVRALST